MTVNGNKLKIIFPDLFRCCTGYALCLLISATANGQLTTTKLEEHFNSYNNKLVQEKLYMHVDRNFYLAGEILWCKLYVVDAVLHQPLDMSKVAYIEILDENNTPALQSKLGLSNGKGNGSLAIPVSIKSGNYKIRAYTSWMKNNGPDYFFEKIITIVNTQKNRDIASTKTAAAAPDIRFFPEGGNLVSGIRSKLACKVTAADGHGLAFTAALMDENNTVVTRFQSLRFGMANFDFTPAANHSYHAVIEAGSKNFTSVLPEIFSKGYVMRIVPSANTISVTVQTNITDTGKLFLLVHTRQSLKTVLESVTENGNTVFTIPRTKLGDGISVFTIITAAGKPVCERLYFTYPARQLNIDISGNLSSYDTRSKVDLVLQPSVQNTKVKDPDMSVAVYKTDELQGIDENNIQTFLWLNSDLKGRIESPGFYFGSNHQEIDPVMDNLMLTQGWRRFKWDDLMNDKTPSIVFAPEYNGHIITGKVVSSVTGKPLENIESYVSVPGLNANLRTNISDASGRVKFDFKSMRGSSEVIVQTNPDIDTTTRIEINNPFFEQFTAAALPSFYLSSSKENILRDQSIGVQAQNLYYANKLKRFMQAVDTMPVFEKPDATYFLDNYTRFTTTEEVLREYVTGINVIKRGSKFSIKVFDDFNIPNTDMAYKGFLQAEPLILMDGIPVFNIDKLMSFDPLKMRKIQVYNRQYYMGNSFFHGIMNFTTYTGDFANFELDPHAVVIDYEGLQLEREFYSPVYDTPQQNSHTPDFRTLLYWAHDIMPDANGEQHIRFYTSDKKGNYVAIIQGLTADGQCGSNMIRFEVK